MHLATTGLQFWLDSRFTSRVSAACLLASRIPAARVSAGCLDHQSLFPAAMLAHATSVCLRPRFIAHIFCTCWRCASLLGLPFAMADIFARVSGENDLVLL